MRAPDPMALGALGRTPVPGPDPAGSPATEGPEYEALAEELARPASLGSGRVDWERVIQLAAGLLADRSKDLRVACQLGAALVETRRQEGLALALEILGDLLEHFWASMTPPPARMRGRRNAVGFLVERLEAAAERWEPVRWPAPRRAAFLARFEAVDALLQARMEAAPNLLPLRQRARDWVLEELAPEPEPEPEPKPAPGSPAEGAAPAPDAQEAVPEPPPDPPPARDDPPPAPGPEPEPPPAEALLEDPAPAPAGFEDPFGARLREAETLRDQGASAQAVALLAAAIRAAPSGREAFRARIALCTCLAQDAQPKVVEAQVLELLAALDRFQLQHWEPGLALAALRAALPALRAMRQEHNENLINVVIVRMAVLDPVLAMNLA